MTDKFDFEERELEAGYRSMAQACAASWPRVSRTLSQIADSFASQAVFWDDRSQKDQLRFQ